MSPNYPEILRLYRKYSVRDGEPLWQVFVRVGQELEGSVRKERCPTCGAPAPQPRVVEWRVQVSLPILAKCRKCGREFVTAPAKSPAFDPFGPADRRYRAGDEIPVCGGEIEVLQQTPGA